MDGQLPAVDGQLPAVDGQLPAVDGQLPAVDGQLPAVGWTAGNSDGSTTLVEPAIVCGSGEGASNARQGRSPGCTPY